MEVIMKSKKARFWGIILLVWSFVAVFALGILDLEPQFRPVGSYEPLLIGQVVGVIVFFLIARKYMIIKGWW